MAHQSHNITNIQAIILAGRSDFGRRPLPSRLPPALWPVGGQPVLERLLRHLDCCGIRQISICGNSDGAILRQAVERMDGIRAAVRFSPEILPLGPAGVIVRTVQQAPHSLILLCNACTACPPDLRFLIQEHQKARAAMTVALNPKAAVLSSTEAADLYLLEPTVLEQIPRAGYCDIKETLIPALLRAGKTVHAVRLPQPVGNFRTWSGYLRAMADYLEQHQPDQPGQPDQPDRPGKNFSAPQSQARDGVWVSPRAEVHPSARLYGPVLVMEGAMVAADAVLVGPCILEKNAAVGPGSLLTGSVLWPEARIGSGSQVRDCVVEHQAVVPDGKIREEQMVQVERKGVLPQWINRAAENMNKKINKIFSLPPEVKDAKGLKPLYGIPSGAFSRSRWPLLWVVPVLLAFLWSHWPTLTDLWKIWMQSDEYSCGLLVPFMAIYIVWSRRGQLAQCLSHPSWWGLAAFLAAQSLRYFGLFFMYGSAERLSLVASIAALVWFLFGGAVFRKLIPIFIFLGLMLPLPKTLEAAITMPLQSMATTSAGFCLEMIGYDIRIEGNIIHLGQTTVAVAEACNGLRMVTSFFVISGLVILLVNRRWWEKGILLLSVLPIALLCNTIRLAITSIAFTILKGEKWEQLFHDFGGYAMMPLALALVVLELWILKKIFTVPDEETNQEILITSAR